MKGGHPDLSGYWDLDMNVPKDAALSELHVQVRIYFRTLLWNICSALMAAVSARREASSTRAAAS